MIRRSLLILSTSLLALGAANAAPVELTEKIGSRERELVNIMFSSYLNDRIGANVQTAVVDLDGDGTGEIIARFLHSNSCDKDMIKCRTTISRFKDGNWHVVFDRHSATVDNVEKGSRRPGVIKVDGMEWKWAPAFNAYQPTKDSRWTDVSWQRVPNEQAVTYASFFGQGAAKLAGSTGDAIIEYSTTPVSKHKDVILLKMSGPSICGNENGCPIRLISQKDGKWSSVLSSTTRGDASLTTFERDGRHDVIMETSAGFVAYGWNGSSYIMADRIEANRKE